MAHVLARQLSVGGRPAVGLFFAGGAHSGRVYCAASVLISHRNASTIARTSSDPSFPTGVLSVGNFSVGRHAILRPFHTSPRVRSDAKDVKSGQVTSPAEGAKSAEGSNVPSGASARAVAESKTWREKANEWWVWIKDGAHHYYMGFKLFGVETKITFRLVRQLLNGHTLTRRERKQLVRTTSDMLRMVPFLVFVIVPFMEFLLPVFLKLFPNMLPSTFQDQLKEEEKLKKLLKVKIEMAKFLQKTVEEMAAVTTSAAGGPQSVADFTAFMKKIRQTGQPPSTDEIVRFSKLFENELTLDSLSRPQLVALCKTLMIPAIGTSNILRFQIRMKLRQLRADDLMIRKEGVSRMAVQELQSACLARGMRAIGIPRDQLEGQLEQWLELHLDHHVPSSLLLLSRALCVTEGAVPTNQELAEALKRLPIETVEEAEANATELEGRAVDRSVRLEMLKKEEARIAEEAKEEIVSKSVQMSPSEVSAEIKDASKKEELVIPVEELGTIKEVVETLSADSMLKPERTDIEELKEERKDYKEELAEMKAQAPEIQADKATTRLDRRVEKIIGRLEKEIEKAEVDLNKAAAASKRLRALIDQDHDRRITTAELAQALGLMRNAPSEDKKRQLIDILDIDKDGQVSVDEIISVVTLLEEEDADVRAEDIRRLMDLLNKESAVEPLDERRDIETKIDRMAERVKAMRNSASSRS